MVIDDDDYPLNCIDDTGDGFSGWFAISNPRRCNDFCYWHLPSSSNSSSYYAAWNTADPHQSTVIHTPMGTAYWTCVYDGADDKTAVSTANGKSWIESWQKYSSRIDDAKPQAVADNVPFPYLRCQKGAGERLKTWSGEVVRSAVFWESWIVLVSLIYVGEFMALLFFYKRGKLRYQQVIASEPFHEVEVCCAGGGHEGGAPSFRVDKNEDDDRGENNDTMLNGSGNGNPGEDRAESSSFLTQFSFLQQRPIHSNQAIPRCKYCTPLASSLCKGPKCLQQSFYILRILLIATLNLLLAFTISFSSISLMEINANPHFREGMQKLTPACSDPTLVCTVGNKDIDRQSAQWPPRESAQGGTDATKPPTSEKKRNAPFPLPPKISSATNISVNTNSASETSSDQDDIMQPFSYIIASDAQLYWFNGEFAEMGRKAIPSSCSPSDSCGRCTGKHGLNTNKRLQKAWGNLMMGRTEGMNATGDLPIPNTLVMNGDLTAYFHPYEKHAYESIYNNIEGLKHYWPSLGNHDVEHAGGATFGGDEWVGVPNCNAEHAIGYFKSGFCGQIPTFNTDRIVRYDSSSLAYSWDEGRYHFVHTHYYPTYEMASMNYRSSLGWLERDLQIAHDSGLTTVLFVHAVQGLNQAMESIILGKNVKAIIAGHTHRCLHRRCEGVYPLHEEQVKDLDSSGLAAEKCIPAAYDTCEVLNGENLIYVKDMEPDVPFPEKRLHNRKDKPAKPLCPQPTPFYINETDNSMLCRRAIYSQPNYPFESGHNSTETIPIFWSGSSSFETFLQGHFFEDKIVINAMAVASEDGEVAKYVDLHAVPNAIHPTHEVVDLEETVIYL